MLKRIVWKNGKVISLKLRDDLYTLVQMRENHYLQFFKISQPHDEWNGIDLSKVDTLFFQYAATCVFKGLASKVVKKVTVDHKPSQKVMLSAIIGYSYCADLIELTGSQEPHEGTVIKHNLSIEEDLDLIYKYELSGMIGNPDKLKNRLLNFFENGINWDESKSFLFKGIPLPKPEEKS